MRSARARGFTLVELLVVLGIVAVLISVLLPALQAAKRAAITTQCASNLRQIAQALYIYANENNGYFPPNTADKQLFWHQKAMIGRTITFSTPYDANSVTGGVMVCPADFEDSVRSYSINVFSSSEVSHFVTPGLEKDPPQGRLYKQGVKQSAAILLLGETWPEQPSTDASGVGLAGGGPSDGDQHFVAESVFGYFKRPGERFGAGAGMDWPLGRFGTKPSQITWYRHRAKPRPSMLEAFGRANFAFVDSHVELLAHDECADFTTGKSRLRALWSLGDTAVDNAPLDPGY